MLATILGLFVACVMAPVSLVLAYEHETSAAVGSACIAVVSAFCSGRLSKDKP
ncbi:MAG TPA: hypothetical protein VF575_05395 [Candidatus Saccharimonadales bacterium]